MGDYSAIAKDNSGNWYVYTQDENSKYFTTRLQVVTWATKNLNGYEWHVAKNC